MTFANFNIYSVIIFLLLNWIVGYLLFVLYKWNKNKFSLLTEVFSPLNILSNGKLNVRRLGLIFLFLSFFFVFLAIFWLRWGLKEQEVEVSGVNVAFVLDVSKSMNAIDEKLLNNSRINLSKRFIGDFVNKFRNNRYSLTIFSAEALKVIPFTFDSDLYNTFLYDVDDQNLSKQGTDLLEAINVWLSNFSGDDGWGVIVVFTDGWEDSYSDFGNLKKELGDRNISLALVWIWSLKGSYIPTWVDVFWRGVYKVYNWERVVTKLNEKVLEDVAWELDWDYFRFDNLTGLKKLEKFIEESVEESMFQKGIKNRKDLTRNFVIVAFCFWIMFLGSLILGKIWKK